MSAPTQAPATASGADPARQGKERVLVFIVVFLGLLIVAGITAVILRIIYLSSGAPAQRTMTETPGAAAVAVPGEDAASRLALPAGAVVKSVSVGGDRLAVHYEAVGGAGIAVLDLASGAIVRRVEVVPGELPR